jgi:hypothetical protein
MHQLLVRADDVNVLVVNTWTLLEATGEVSLDVNAEKHEYMVMPCQKNAAQNDNLLIVNK